MYSLPGARLSLLAAIAALSLGGQAIVMPDGRTVSLLLCCFCGKKCVTLDYRAKYRPWVGIRGMLMLATSLRINSSRLLSLSLVWDCLTQDTTMSTVWLADLIWFVTHES